MKRLILAAAGALALAAGASACSTVKPDAATVNGTSIRDSFQSELQAVADSPAFLSVLGATSTPGTLPSTVSAGILSLRIQNVIFGDELAKRGTTELTAEQTANGKQEFITRLTPSGGQPSAGEATYNALPKAEQDFFTELFARQAVLGEQLQPADEAAITKAYNDNPTQFTEICASAIIVANADDATAVTAELAQGTAFADVAKTKSIDSSGANGGALRRTDGTCPRESEVTQALGADVVTDLKAAPLGKPTAPVQTSNGYAIFLIDSINVLPLSQVHDEAKALAATGAQDAVSAFLLNAAKSATVSVNPVYGTWDASQAQVRPPSSASTTTVAAATAPAGASTTAGG